MYIKDLTKSSKTGQSSVSRDGTSFFIILFVFTLVIGHFILRFISSIFMPVPWYVLLIPNLALQVIVMVNVIRFGVFKEHQQEETIPDEVAASRYVKFVLENTLTEEAPSGDKYHIVEYVDGNSAIFLNIKLGHMNVDKIANNEKFIAGVYKRAIAEDMVVKTHISYENLENTKSFKELVKGIHQYKPGFTRMIKLYIDMIRDKIKEKSRVMTYYIIITTKTPGRRRKFSQLVSSIAGDYYESSSTFRELEFMDKDSVKRYTKELLGVTFIDFESVEEEVSNLRNPVKVIGYRDDNGEYIEVNGIKPQAYMNVVKLNTGKANEKESKKETKTNETSIFNESAIDLG